jgi:hypothetical protein
MALCFAVIAVVPGLTTMVVPFLLVFPVLQTSLGLRGTLLLTAGVGLDRGPVRRIIPARRHGRAAWLAASDEACSFTAHGEVSVVRSTHRTRGV